jgi:hypothetical protein
MGAPQTQAPPVAGPIVLVHVGTQTCYRHISGHPGESIYHLSIYHHHLLPVYLSSIYHQPITYLSIYLSIYLLSFITFFVFSLLVLGIEPIIYNFEC